MKKTCEECGKKFETTNANVKYCSDVCRVKARRKKQYESAKKRYREMMNVFRRTV